MQPQVIIINFNEETPTPDPKRISVLSGTRITFEITLPRDCTLTPTITFHDTDLDADAVAINDPDNVINHSKATNTYKQDIIPEINKPQALSSQKKFTRNYLVKLIKTVPAEYPLRDRVENRSPIGEPPTSSGKIEVSGGHGTELPSLV